MRPGETPPTAGEVPRWTEADFRISAGTARALDEAPPENTENARDTVWRGFEKWCRKQGRLARPCTTATYTEYARHLMDRGLKVNTIKTYMSNIRARQPIGEAARDPFTRIPLGGHQDQADAA